MSMMSSATFCRHGVPAEVKGHDCEYTDLRESIVPDAERFADATVGGRPEMNHGVKGNKATNPAYEAWVKAWNKAFFAFIDLKIKEYMAVRRSS